MDGIVGSMRIFLNYLSVRMGLMLQIALNIALSSDTA